MYAIIETGGKQYQVRAGDEVFIEKLGADENETVTFDKVVALAKEGEFEAGNPYVSGAKATATVIKNGKGKKINIFTYRRKQGSSHKRQGHRQPYTRVRIDALYDASGAVLPAAKPAKEDGGFKNYTAERLMKAQEKGEA